MAQLEVGCTTSMDAVQRQQRTRTILHGAEHYLNQTSNGVFNNVTSEDVEHASKRRRVDIGNNRIEASKITTVASGTDTRQPENSRTETLEALPSLSQNALLFLSHPRYGLPDILVNNLVSLGIGSVYPWQSSCLLGHGLLEGEKNLVYTAPTGGGKSLVADVLMLKRVIEDPSKKAILVLPYVALVQEKVKWLRKVVEDVRKDSVNLSQAGPQTHKWRKHQDGLVRVVGFFGGSKARASWTDVDIAVCTVEKVSTIESCII